MFTHSWIYYYLSTVLDAVWPGSTKRNRRYEPWMNDTRVRFTCQVKQHSMVCAKILWIHWDLFLIINNLLFVIGCSFLTSILLHCEVLSFKSPCNLNASTGKQQIDTYSSGIHVYTLLAVGERSKPIWRPNTFMN